MSRKVDSQTALLKAILAELQRLNANLERRTEPPEIVLKEMENDESEDMEEFE